MITITDKLDIKSVYDFTQSYDVTIEEILFFDIETTGFAAETTALYLVGVLYYKNGSWNTIQWFADNSSGELEILHSFFTFLKDYKLLVHYNGDGFDIPYLLKKCARYGLRYNFEGVKSLDIYKKIAPFRKYFNLENLKQRTVEKYLDVERKDIHTGGELIHVYEKYYRAQIEKCGGSEEYFYLLVLHNAEDIKGLLLVSQVLNYSNLFTQDFSVLDTELKDNELILSLHTSCSIPKRISCGNDILYFSAFKENATMKIQLYKEELKFFYQNYKDYYYLPTEDTAIHKSVAFYVDKNFRTKAKAANCYSKKTGCFIPQYSEIVTPYFKIDYYDKITYVETTPDFLADKELLGQYAKHLIPHL